MIDDLRKQIDLIDRDISQLFQKRLEIVLKIGKIKSSENIDICDEEREERVLNKVKNNVSSFSQTYVETLYRKIFEISKECQENERYNCKK